MREFSSEAIILRHLDYGEADRIVTFLTPGHGRLKGFARSARNSRKRFGAALEPFSRVRLHWTAPRSGDLVSLKEADLLDLRAGLRAELSAIALAGYGCELVDELFGEQQGHVEVFDLLDAFLDHLAAGGAAPESRLLLELRLLNLAGYMPHLLHCSACSGTLGSGAVVFDAERGGSLCRGCAGGVGGVTVSLPTLGSLARSLKAPFTLFKGFRLSSTTLNEGGHLVAEALRPHLHGPLKSRDFLARILSG